MYTWAYKSLRILRYAKCHNYIMSIDGLQIPIPRKATIICYMRR